MKTPKHINVPERKVAVWIINDGGYMDVGDADFIMKCIKCGAEYYHVEGKDDDYNYCPNCGVKMEGEIYE